MAANVQFAYEPTAGRAIVSMWNDCDAKILVT